VGDQVSQTILLCEDNPQERCLLSFLAQAGVNRRSIRSLVASRLQHGGNAGWVLQEFPRQLRACRQRSKLVRTQLLVMLDADDFSVAQRWQQLADRVQQDGDAKLDLVEPVAILVPKRHIETWLCCLLGQPVTESEDCKAKVVLSKNNFRTAGQQLYQWSRQNARPGPTCVESLNLALPQLRKIVP